MNYSQEELQRLQDALYQTLAEVDRICRKHGIRYFVTGGTAIVVGTEATGLTDAWRKAADAHIRIPMLGELDSLNASVSAAILLYEAVRQRNV